MLGPTTTTIWTASDHICTWEVSYRHNSLGGGELYGEKKAKTALAQRRAQVQFAYGADLDLLLSPAYLWRYMDPANPGQPDSKPVYVTSGPFGSSGRESGFDDNPDGKPITRIVVYAGSRVDGLEVFYGGRSGGLHGKRGGDTHALDLAPGETIVSASGRGGDGMDALYFKTSGGREVGGGGGGGGPWYAGPPQGSNATLYKVSGKQGSAHLAALNLTWSYLRFPPLPSQTPPLGTFDVTNKTVDDFPGWSATAGVRALLGDFAGNGRTSIALVGGPGWTTVPLAFSNGDGSFTVTNKPDPNLPKWAASSGVQAVVGHFDDSGRDAIALIGPISDAVQTIPVAFSNGDGTFKVIRQPAVNFPGSAAGVKAVAGRFDDSGYDAIVLVGFKGPGGYGAEYMPVAFTKGDGNFVYAPKISPNPDQSQMLRRFQELATMPGASILTGDFDGNGRTSIALVGGAGWTTLPVAHSTGDGGFTITNPPLPQFTGWAASGGVKPVVGRFDKSGADAIALIGGPGWSTIPVAFSKKDGNFTVTNQPVVGFQNWGAWPGVKVLTGDFAGNGLTSIALTGPGGWASIPVAFPTGGGNFDITSRTVPDFPGFAAANGAKVLAGDFAGTGITALALIGGSGWRSLPVAFSSPPPPAAPK